MACSIPWFILGLFCLRGWGRGGCLLSGGESEKLQGGNQFKDRLNSLRIKSRLGSTPKLHFSHCFFPPPVTSYSTCTFSAAAVHFPFIVRRSQKSPMKKRIANELNRLGSNFFVDLFGSIRNYPFLSSMHILESTQIESESWVVDNGEI